MFDLFKDYTYVCKYYSLPKEMYTLTKKDEITPNFTLIFLSNTRKCALGLYNNTPPMLAAPKDCNTETCYSLTDLIFCIGKAYA